MAGDERQLRYELLDAARGRKPRTNFWNKDQANAAYFSGAGSQNIWLMRFAAQALEERMGDRPGYSGGDLELARAVYAYQLGPAAVGLPADTATVSPAGDLILLRPGFGGSEFMSTIYWSWHMLSHLALCRCKDQQVAGWARRWSVLNWALFRAIQAPDGSLMLFGQRSAGHNPKPREVDWFFALASDGDVKRAEKWCKEAGAGLRRSWEFEIGNELLPEMRATWQESLSISPEDLPAFIPLRVPTEIIRTSEGLAVVHAATCNPNTPPILAGTFTDRLRVLPPDGGHRIRQKFDHATARVDGGEIVYQSSLYTGGAEVRMPLPGGDVIYHFRLGSGAVNPPTVNPIEPPHVTPIIPVPVSPADLSRAADLLAGLQLSKKHGLLRDAAVPQLRSNPSAQVIARIAAEVDTFGIGSKQLQYLAWREAVQILKGTGA